MNAQIFSPRPIYVGLFAVVAATLPMRADDSPPYAVMCLGLSVVNPQGDDLASRSGTGFGGSLSWEWAIKRKHALRATLEYAKFSDKTYYYQGHEPESPQEEYQGNANVLFAALDYIYRFVSHDKGLYISVGAGYGNTSVKPDTNWYGNSISGFGWGFSAGVGYNFTKNFGLDVSALVTSTYHPKGSYPLHFYSWNQVSLKYRFSTQGGAK